MRAVDALETLELLGSSQWGLVTTAQARSAGLTKLQLARLADRGTLSRVRQGVYALPSAGSDPLQGLHAAWLATSPRYGTVQGKPPKPVVVSGSSAAAVHKLGDLVPSRHEFTADVRRQSSQPDVRFRRADLSPDDVTLVDGLPVTTVERTVADLTDQAVDADHLATVLSDAVTRSEANPRALARALDRNAHRYLAESGADLLVQLAPSAATYWSVLAKSLASGLNLDFPEHAKETLAKLVSEAVDPSAMSDALSALAGLALESQSDRVPLAV